MSLTSIIQGIGKERRDFTNSFREFITSSISDSDLSNETQNYLEEALTDEGMTRYYRFSVTAANELIGFGFEIEHNRVAEMKKGMGLMLFWLRLADRYLDTYGDYSHTIDQVNDYLEHGGELPTTEYPLTASLYFATKILREHGLQEGYIPNMISPLREMTRAMRDEFIDLDNVRAYCDAKEQTGVTLANTLLAIMRFYVGEHDTQSIRRLERFYHGQFKAAMHFDTLVDFDKDYDAGIAPKPNLKNKVYIGYRMAKEIGLHFLQLPKSLSGITRVMSYSAVSTYHILRDAPTQG